MWMVGYNEGAEFSLPDSLNGRKLRPLIPRPPTEISTTSYGRSSCSSFSSHGTDLLALNHHHHMVTMAEQGKRQQVIINSRWNPAPEQLRVLEEIFRSGTRTPSAEEIQRITEHLTQYGKIEGKNVFYWFQNHKSRERQKRRRKLQLASDEQPFFDIDDIQRKESGAASRTGFEAEQGQTKNCSWASPTNCKTLGERTVSIERAAKGSECKGSSDGWIQFEELSEFQHRRTSAERNASWQMMHSSSSLSPQSTCNLVSYTTTTSSTTTPPTVTTMDPDLIKPQYLNILTTTPKISDDLNHTFTVGDDRVHESRKSQTLQLFPLRNDVDDYDETAAEKEITEISMGSLNMNSTPRRFFEFIPLKN